MMGWLAAQAAPIAASILFAVIGTLTLVGLVWVVEALCPFSIRKEIEDDHNTSMGIILGAFMISVAIIIAAAIRG